MNQEHYCIIARLWPSFMYPVKQRIQLSLILSYKLCDQSNNQVILEEACPWLLRSQSLAIYKTIQGVFYWSKVSDHVVNLIKKNFPTGWHLELEQLKKLYIPMWTWPVVLYSMDSKAKQIIERTLSLALSYWPCLVSLRAIKIGPRAVTSTCVHH